jgi:hypothetical protein
MVTVMNSPEVQNHLTVDDLAQLTVAQAAELYRRGAVPAMQALDGAPRGRMLAIRGFDRGFSASPLRTYARSKGFPWAGKSFASARDDMGTGVNRVRLFRTRNWFPFDTRVGPSAIDGAPCIVLDYDKPRNPWLIRHLHDELREVAPGLFLGPAMWKSSSARRLLLYFAIDAQPRAAEIHDRPPT